MRWVNTKDIKNFKYIWKKGLKDKNLKVFDKPSGIEFMRFARS